MNSLAWVAPCLLLELPPRCWLLLVLEKVFKLLVFLFLFFVVGFFFIQTLSISLWLVSLTKGRLRSHGTDLSFPSVMAVVPSWQTLWSICHCAVDIFHRSRGIAAGERNSWRMSCGNTKWRSLGALVGRPTKLTVGSELVSVYVQRSCAYVCCGELSFHVEGYGDQRETLGVTPCCLTFLFVCFCKKSEAKRS